MSYLTKKISMAIEDLDNKNILEESITFKLKKRLYLNLKNKNSSTLFDKPTLIRDIVKNININVTNNLSIEEEELLFKMVDIISKNISNKYDLLSDNEINEEIEFYLFLYVKELKIVITENTK